MIKKVERLCIFEDGFQKAAKRVQIVATTRRAQIFLSAVAFRRRAVKYGRQEYETGVPSIAKYRQVWQARV